MKINRLVSIRVAYVFFLALVGVSLPCLPAHSPANTGGLKNSAVIPGDIDRICYYTDFFYNYSPGEFFYFFNDRLLFLEKPNGTLTASGLRNKLLKIVRWHNVIKKALERHTRGKNTGNRTVTFNVSEKNGFKKMSVFLDLMGLQLFKDKGEHGDVYSVTRNPAPTSRFSDYSRFTLLNPGPIERELNDTLHFRFKFRESKVSQPWDYRFLSRITGLQIDSGSFFEEMLKNERFSLLLGTLYRLSHREISYIDAMTCDSRRSTRGGAWNRIYNDETFLMGMFLLSNALRVTGVSGEKEGTRQWLLPGGTGAETFWTTLIGKDQNTSPFEFLHHLSTKDEGKLNYLFQFAAFLPPDTQRALFVGANGPKTDRIYRLVSLDSSGKLKGTQFPKLKHSTLYTMLYALRLQGDRFHFPGGKDVWEAAIRLPSTAGNVTDAPGNTWDTGANLLDILTGLLEESKGNGNSVDKVKKFVSIYTKFHNRPGLLTARVLHTFYHNYEEYNILVDFIEKLPVKDPWTVITLFQWVNGLESLNKKDRVLFVSIFQSLLELFSHAFKYAPEDRYDCDLLLEKLVEIPFNGYIYENIFRFLETELNIGPGKRTLIDFLLEGVENVNLSLKNVGYQFHMRDIYRKCIRDTLRTQEVFPLETFWELNRLLDRIVRESKNGISTGDTAMHISGIFDELPYAGISKDAPGHIRDRVIPFSRSSLEKNLKKLAVGKGLRTITGNIKRNFLLYRLKDYLLALTYAVNAKNPGLRIFLNPNLVRLHDFECRKGRTPWNYCGTPHIFDEFSEYHLSGGLSRLNLSMAAKWQNDLFNKTFIYNPRHVQSVIVNLLELYPSPRTPQVSAYNSLLVDFGMELLRSSRDNQNLRNELLNEIGTVTSGYHYRKAVEYLTGDSQEPHLFFTELKRLGEVFLGRGKYLEESGYAGKLYPFTQSPLKGVIGKENDRFGGIYYRTFGNLAPRQFTLFPQEVSNLFGSGWVSGEMVEEFKIKLGWHLYKGGIPSFLLGRVLYSYLNNAAPHFLSQNHSNDYFATYFIFDIFNDSHLNHIIKNLQKEGYLKLK